MGEERERQHEEFMREALAEARKALALEEVPIGAVLVRDGCIIGRGHNLRETEGDPTAHAEIIALREAARALGVWRLSDTTMYVTIEPCPMCAGALVMARVGHLVYGSPDPKGGGVDSLYNIGRNGRLNHTFTVTGGVLEGECAQLLRDFFRRLRA
ncbi:MAG TPA: nucleoside deaminase [Firmicutes bacterium]|jgi:tRNA(adenine34) deaminase|nr:nucleoside deaminase [Bacillota bacterium]